MTDATAVFFEELGKRGHEPLLEKVTGSVRFDLAHARKTERWRLVAEKGDIAVSRKSGPADLVLRMDRALFGRVTLGEMNLTAAVLRGDVVVEGAWRLLVLVQRVFPGPQDARERGRAAGYARRMS